MIIARILIVLLVMSSILFTATKSYAGAGETSFILALIDATVKGVRARDKKPQLPDTSWLEEETVNTPVVPKQNEDNKTQDVAEVKIQRVLTPEQERGLNDAKMQVQQIMLERAKKIQAFYQ